MNHLKKIFVAIAVTVALGLVGATSASAQISCTANSVPTLVRSQGIAELTGSIVLNCGTTASAAASLTVSIQPSAAVITNSPTAGFIPTIDIDHAGVTAGVVAGNTVTFPVPALAAAAGGHTIVIGVDPGIAGTVGIRANVFASGVVFPSQIAGLITSSPAGVLAITNNFLNVAIPQAGLAVSYASTPAVTQCASATLKGQPTTFDWNATNAKTFTATDPVTGSAKAAAAVQLVTATEGFSSAWSNKAGEGFDATQGTQIQIQLGPLPSNVLVMAPNDILVGNSNIGGTGVPELILIESGQALVAGGSHTAATIITGSTITYEVVTSSNAVTEAVIIPVGFFTLGTPSPGGTFTANTQLAPVSSVGTAVSSPIPRFGAAATAGNMIVVVPCLTNILFPWVANTSGYDTGFAIANTTSDIFGTAAQAGTCVYNFYGNNAPSGGTFTTKSVAAGTVDTQLLSAIAPGFSGYVLIQCNFQLGHGFNFISNGFGGGAVTVGQGGIGLVLAQPTATGTGTGSRKAAAGFVVNGQVIGESVGH